MKDSKIAAGLAGYLHTIMPSTPSAPVEIGGRHGVRVQLTDRFWFDLLLVRAQWVASYLNDRAMNSAIRIPVTSTYPLATVHLAHMVADTVAPLAWTPMMIPLDRASEQAFLSWKTAEGVRLREATDYLQQVAGDPNAPWPALPRARRALESLAAKIADLEDHRKNPGLGPPTPLHPPEQVSQRPPGLGMSGLGRV